MRQGDFAGLRAEGVASRLAVGYTPGDRTTDGNFLVRDSNAHGWPQVFFPGYGWIDFEATLGWTMPQAEFMPEEEDETEIVGGQGPRGAKGTKGAVVAVLEGGCGGRRLPQHHCRAHRQELEGLAGDHTPCLLVPGGEVACEADVGGGNLCGQPLVWYPVDELAVADGDVGGEAVDARPLHSLADEAEHDTFLLEQLGGAPHNIVAVQREVGRV